MAKLGKLIFTHLEMQLKIFFLFLFNFFKTFLNQSVSENGIFKYTDNAFVSNTSFDISNRLIALSFKSIIQCLGECKNNALCKMVSTEGDNKLCGKVKFHLKLKISFYSIFSTIKF